MANGKTPDGTIAKSLEARFGEALSISSQRSATKLVSVLTSTNPNARASSSAAAAAASASSTAAASASTAVATYDVQWPPVTASDLARYSQVFATFVSEDVGDARSTSTGDGGGGEVKVAGAEVEPLLTRLSKAASKAGQCKLIQVETRVQSAWSQRSKI